MSHGITLQRTAHSIWIFTAVVLLSMSACQPVAKEGGEGGRGGHPAIVKANDCQSGGLGSDNGNHPIICVDDATLTADPKQVTVNDVEGRKGGVKTTLPVMIKWQTTSGSGNLQVSFPDGNACVDQIKCDKKGECTAKTLPQKKIEGSTCTYDVTLGGKKVDPTIIVTPCCI